MLCFRDFFENQLIMLVIAANSLLMDNLYHITAIVHSEVIFREGRYKFVQKFLENFGHLKRIILNLIYNKSVKFLS